MDVVKTDVLIIGAGVTGTSAAWRLAESGREAILLDKGRVGEEASGRNGGGVRQQYRDPAETPLSIKAVAMWAEMTERFDVDVEYDRGGNIRLLRSEEELAVGRTRVERENSMGLEVNLLSREEVYERLPLLSPEAGVLGGTHCPTDGTANPLKVAKAIGRAAQAAGAVIRINEPALRFRVADGRIKGVITDKAEYQAQSILLCAGPWTAGLLFELGVPLYLIVKKIHLLITEPLPPRIPGFVSWNTGYTRQAKDGNIHVGVRTASNKGFDKTLEYQALMDGGRDFPEIFPFLRDVNIIRAFSGLITYTADAIPVIDRVPGVDNMYLAAGFSGHGFCLGPYVGRVMADWISSGDCPEDLSAFSIRRFQ